MQKTTQMYSFRQRSATVLVRTASLLAAAVFGANVLHAQELNVNVSVNVDLISQERREDLLTMKQDLERYFKAQSFTGKEWKNEQDKLKWKDEPVEIDLTITILSRADNTYTANLLVTGKRAIYGSKGGKTNTLTVLDKKWTFQYFRNAELSFQPLQFNRFNTLIDFYVLVMIGMDLDSFYELGGSEMFQKAQLLWQNGANATSFSSAEGYNQTKTDLGEMTRFDLVNELTDPRFEEFRKLIIQYYVFGLDAMAENKDKALGMIVDILEDMAKFKDKTPGRSVLMQMFFDAKYRELCELFRGNAKFGEAAFRKLKYVDNSHSTAYEMARQGRQ
jgi:hypothetical protein